MKTIFLQPRNTYASEEGNGDTNLTPPLITAAARIKAAGYKDDIEIRDENFADRNDKTTLDANVVGINLVGAPYIPQVIEIIRDRIQAGTTVLLGGQIIGSLSQEEFDKLFRFREDVTVLNGNNDPVLEETFAVQEIPAQEQVSSIPVWQTISDADWHEYLSREFSFYISQGCKYGCTFCQAKNGVREKYRDQAVMEQDLKWLAEKAKSLGIQNISFYASNLDTFQTPNQLGIFATTLTKIAEETGVKINWRGLSTVKSFLDADPALMEAVKASGFTAVGFGVDGDPSTWEANHKQHNGTSTTCEAAIERAHKTGFTPEILMVYGHPTDTEKTMQSAHDFCATMKEQFAAVARPHIAKHTIPGTAAWRKNRDIAEQFLTDPSLFRALDYTALASSITHAGGPESIASINRAFVTLCEMGGSTSTKWVYPNVPEWEEFATQQGTTIQKLNEGKFDR